MAGAGSLGHGVGAALEVRCWDGYRRRAPGSWEVRGFGGARQVAK